MRRAPLAVAAVLLALGIAAGGGPSEGRGILLPAIAAVAAWAWAWRQRERPPFARGDWVPVAFALVAAGFLSGSVARRPQRADDVRFGFGEDGRFARIRGVCLTEPRRLTGSRDPDPHPAFRFTLGVREEVAPTTVHAASGRIQVDVTARAAETASVPAVGEWVEIAGGVRLPPRSGIPGARDPRSALAAAGIHYRLRCSRAADLCILRDRPPTLRRRFDVARGFVRSRITLGLDDDPAPAGLLAALLVGDRTEVDDDAWDPFTRVGAMHIFAISGLHVGLLALVLETGLRLLRVPRRIRPFALLPILLLYVMMTGARPSSVRAFVMAAAILGGQALARPLNGYNALGLAAVSLLALHPLQLFDVGFQLSFSVVATLVLVAAPVREQLAALAAPDPFLPRSLVSRRRRAVQISGARVAVLASASFGAWLGSIPLSAARFHLVPVVALAANLAVVPIASAVVAIGAMSLVGGLIHPEIGITMNHANRLLVQGLGAVVGGLSRVPGGHFYVRAFPAWLAALWFAGLVAWFGPFSRRRLVRPAVIAAAAAVAALGIGRWAFDRSWEVTFPSLAGGECAVIDGPRGCDRLVDAGPRWSGRNVMVRLLRFRGWDRLPTAFLSHPDSLHVGGWADLAEAWPAARWVAFPWFAGEWARRGVTGLPADVSPSIALPGAGPVVVRPFGRPWGAGAAYDDGAAAVSVAGPGATVVVGGDAPLESIARAVRAAPPGALILQAPRNGRWSPGWDHVLDARPPDLCVVVSGRFESESAPDSRSIAALEDRGIPWVSTQKAGTIVLRFDGRGGFLAEAWHPSARGPNPTRLDVALRPASTR